MSDTRRPTPLSAELIMRTLHDMRISHLVIVPDTYQESFLSEAAMDSQIKTVFACTEDEAVGINAGLYATGRRPIISMQNNGLFACLNTIRGIALDGEIPTVMFIGQYGHKPDIEPEASPLRMVRMLEPTLKTWDVPFVRLWNDQDLQRIPDAYEEALTRRGPTGLIIPIPTGA